MKALNERDEEFAPTLTPLIDVAFLLIVFFLVSTSFVKPEKTIDILLPRAEQAQKTPAESNTLIVNVRESGLTVVDGRVLSEYEELVALMRNARENKPNLQVVVRGDKRARHEHVVRVMNAALEAGIEGMSIHVADTRSEQ
jgi:biopolymer transport protein ExbD